MNFLQEMHVNCIMVQSDNSMHIQKYTTSDEFLVIADDDPQHWTLCDIHMDDKPIILHIEN